VLCSQLVAEARRSPLLLAMRLPVASSNACGCAAAALLSTGAGDLLGAAVCKCCWLVVLGARLRLYQMELGGLLGRHGRCRKAEPT
jgi:hypothetical protein